MKKIIDRLSFGGSYILLPHVNADGDALGSCLALSEIICALGGSAVVVAEEEVSYNLKFLADDVMVYSEGEDYIADCVISVDCGDLKRLGRRSILFKNARETICIDHHMTNGGGFAKFEYIDSAAAATAEIVYDIALAAKVPVSGKTAKYIYTAILSDTGGFRYSNTTEKTLRIAAELMSEGVQSAELCTQLFENKKFSQLKIEAAAINEVEFYFGGALAIVTVTEKMLKEAGAGYDDADALSAIIRGISGVLVAVVIKEKEGKSKISMRSKGVDISAVCREMGGGGHMYAAGAEMDLPPDKCRKKVLEIVLERLKPALS